LLPTDIARKLAGDGHLTVDCSKDRSGLVGRLQNKPFSSVGWSRFPATMYGRGVTKLASNARWGFDLACFGKPRVNPGVRIGV
jgi:hypothetical protein